MFLASCFADCLLENRSTAAISQPAVYLKRLALFQSISSRLAAIAKNTGLSM